MTQEVVCPDCKGLTVQWHGKGLDTQYRVCPNWQIVGHLTEAEIVATISRTMQLIRPSGRYT